MVKFWVANISTLLEPSTASSATTELAFLLELATLRTPGWRLGSGSWVGLVASAVTSSIEGFHDCFSRIEKT